RFVAFEPRAGWRHAEVTAPKTGTDFAHVVRRWVDEPYPDAAEVVLVLDNLSTRTPASLYEAFEPAEARRLCERLGWHDAPKHGSRPNVAECERSVSARQCLDRRIPDRDTLRREVASWERDRNAAAVAADWPFTTADARTRSKRLDPVIETATSALAD